MRAFSGAIFDLDGTLLDSMGVWIQIDFEFLARHHLTAKPGYVEAINAMGFLQAAEYTKKLYGLPQKPEEIVREWHALSIEAYRDRVQLKPHAGDYLNRLKEKGVKIGLATASSRELYEPALRRLGVYPLFDAFTTSDEVGADKEKPDIYLLAARRLGVPARECCVFEDILKGICGARLAGMQTVGVADAASAFEREAILARADRFIEDFQELM